MAAAVLPVAILMSGAPGVLAQGSYFPAAFSPLKQPYEYKHGLSDGEAGRTLNPDWEGIRDFKDALAKENKTLIDALKDPSFLIKYDPMMLDEIVYIIFNALLSIQDLYQDTDFNNWISQSYPDLLNVQNLFKAGVGTIIGSVYEQINNRHHELYPNDFSGIPGVGVYTYPTEKDFNDEDAALVGLISLLGDSMTDILSRVGGVIEKFIKLSPSNPYRGSDERMNSFKKLLDDAVRDLSHAVAFLRIKQDAVRQQRFDEDLPQKQWTIPPDQNTKVKEKKSYEAVINNNLGTDIRGYLEVSTGSGVAVFSGAVSLKPGKNVVAKVISGQSAPGFKFNFIATDGRVFTEKSLMGAGPAVPATFRGPSSGFSRPSSLPSVRPSPTVTRPSPFIRTPSVLAPSVVAVPSLAPSGVSNQPIFTR
mgnify:CR=1 FL=1